VGAVMKTRDRALIDECLHGRINAFGELIEPYQDRLFNTLYRVVGSHDEASELLQESLIRAYKGLATYQGDSAFYTWLYRIAMNVTFGKRRGSSLKLFSTEDLGNRGIEFPDESDDVQPVRRMEIHETHDLIHKALGQLEDSFRAIIVLKDIEELRYEQISEILDIPIGTVKSRLHRARVELRELLKPLIEQGRI
jgi:RNA polymerase sigma-70 factor, ECF subfamily